MEKFVIGVLITVTLSCFVNLIPYLMIIFMWLSKEDTTTYKIFSVIKSLFELPTSLIFFIIKESIGEVLWVISNVVLLGASFFSLKSI